MLKFTNTVANTTVMFWMMFGISRFTSIVSILRDWSSHQHDYEVWGLLLNDIKHCLVMVFTDDTHTSGSLSGSWRMRRAGSRRPWRRRPLPNCPCPSRAACPGTAQPRLLATPVVTWRLPSHPPSHPPPPSAAAHLQVRQVCVFEMSCGRRKDGLLVHVWSDWRCWNWLMKLTPPAVTEKSYSYCCAIGRNVHPAQAALWWANEDICNPNGMQVISYLVNDFIMRAGKLAYNYFLH